MTTSRPFHRLAALFLSAVLLLTACQGSTPTPEPTGQPTPGEPTQPPVIELPTGAPSPEPSPTLPAHLAVQAEDLRGQEITFWHPWQGTLEQRAREAVTKFNLSNTWGIRVSAQAWYSTGALEDALMGALEAGGKELPDLIAATPPELSVLADGGAVLDLTGYTHHPQWGMSSEQMEAYASSFWAEDTRDQVRLGIPLLRTGRVLLYNQTWARELGFPNPPTTPLYFEAQACPAAVKNNQSGYLDLFGTGGWRIDTDAITGLSWLDGFGAGVAVPGETPGYVFDSPPGQAAVTYLQGLLAKGCAWIPRSAPAYDDFARRRALFITAWLEDLPGQMHVMEEQKRTDVWSVIGFPAKEGKPLVYTTGYSLALTQNPAGDSDVKAQAAAWLFLRWLSDPARTAGLVEAWPSFPVSTQIAAQVTGYPQSFPWDRIQPVSPATRPIPADADWFIASRVLQDATWSIFHLPPDQGATILPQADETLKELLSQPR